MIPHPVLQLVMRKLNDNAQEARRLAAQADQHADTINRHAETLERLQLVEQVLLREARVQTALLRRVVTKLEHRDE